MTTLIHENPWRILAERLNAIVAFDATLAPARALVKAPVDLLAALGEDVEAALGNDRLALERLRALLSMSAVHAQPFSTMRALLAGGPAGATGPAASGGRDLLHDPGTTTIVDVGGLVLTALAAARAGAEVGLPDAFVDHALALVLAATPAEALSRAVGSGLTDSQLRAAVAALVPTDGSDRHLSVTLASFIADPVERERWRALDSLFALVRQGQPVIWEGATSEGITAVHAPSACSGDMVEIHVRLQPHAARNGPPHIAGLLNALAAGDALVVFASSTHPPTAVHAKRVNKATGVVRVTLPPETRAGWIGVTSPGLVAASNASREQLRAFWRLQNDQHPALRHAPVPVDAIALLPEVPTPPRTAGGRFDGGLPVIEMLAIDPMVVDADSYASLRWRVAGADRVTIDQIGRVADAGVAQLEVATGQSKISARLVAANACGEARAAVDARVRVRITELQVHLAGSKLPPHEGTPATVTARLSPSPKGVRARVYVGPDDLPMDREGDCVSGDIPSHAVKRQLAGRVRVFVDGDRPDDDQSFGPIIAGVPGRRRIVLLRPVRLSPTFARVSIDAAREAVQSAQRELGVVIDVVSAPWLEAAGLAIDGVASGAGTPATRRLLERVNALAADAAELEDAVWVALVPGADRIAVSRAGDAAATIAIASPSALGEVLRQPSSLQEPQSDRLCLIGSVDAVGSVRIDRVFRRYRAIGPGAPVDTGLRVFGVDGTGRDVSSAPVRLQSDVLPARFVALLPMSPEITRAEVRVVNVSNVIDTSSFRPDPASSGRWVARRIDRVVGEPALSNVRLRGGRVQWNDEHGRGVQLSVAIELGRDGGWWPIHRPSRDPKSVELLLDRFDPRRADQIRVVLSDGWNTVTSDPLRAPSVKGRRVIAHYAGDRRFWTDIDDEGGDVRWQIGGLRRTGPVVAVPRGFVGAVQLMVGSGRRMRTDRRLIDTREAHHVSFA